MIIRVSGVVRLSPGFQLENTNFKVYYLMGAGQNRLYREIHESEEHGTVIYH
jgi:hypothetical protein